MKNQLHIKTFLKRNRIVFCRSVILVAIVITLSLSFTSCEKGEYGQPGYAYVAFTWVDAEPDYIEIVNDYIPAVFFWNWFYRVDPGIYSVYYEGKHNRRTYAWELEYEVWENDGKRAEFVWIEPKDGPDAYFTVELSPFGPEVIYEEVEVEKQGYVDDSDDHPAEIGHEIILEKHQEEYSLRLRYKRVEPRHIK